MAPEKIKHFLVVYDIPAGQADVREFGTDYDAALRAYDAAEEAHREDPDHEVVLLGSDSLETLKKSTRATSTSAIVTSTTSWDASSPSSACASKGKDLRPRSAWLSSSPSHTNEAPRTAW